MKRLVVAALLCSVAFHAHARRVELVAFPSLDRDASGASVIVHAILLLPPGDPPKGGRSAIVALHGCGGMYSRREGHEHELSPGFALRANPLLRDRYAVLFVDSFRSRGLSQICTTRYRERTVKIAERRLDALGALAYLQRRTDIAANRIALVGWSHGGSATLWTIGRGAPIGNDPFFRAAVAFYPGCAGPLKAGDTFHPAAPTRIYIGELDDWTPASSCVALGNEMAARNEDLLVTTYPDSYHAFDSSFGQVVLRKEVPNGVHPGQGVHTGPNPAARDAAIASMRAFLRERMAPGSIERSAR
ncbi:MAG TPA: dienelactone hydrolase family protein [Casimicrobiaceae bacterium]|nr:dienelactone hydrolase family protein [Casimicrobiaceae bacterium]